MTLINPPINQSIIHHHTKETWRLRSADSSFITSDSYLHRIVKICNQPHVYNMLFINRLNSQPYSLKNAANFIHNAKIGWQDQTRFTFFIIDPNNELMANIRLKSNNLESTEIGYWSASESRGIMTNALKAVIAIAQAAGYKSLFANTKISNTRSQNLLSRCSFHVIKQFTKDGLEYNRYQRDLVI